MKRLAILGLVAAGLLSGACGGGEQKAASLTPAEMSAKAAVACGTPVSPWSVAQQGGKPVGTKWFMDSGKIGTPSHVAYVTPAGEVSECLSSCEWDYSNPQDRARNCLP